MLYGSHRLYLALKSIRMTSHASMLVGHWAPQKIVDAFVARNYTICNLYTLASFS